MFFGEKKIVYLSLLQDEKKVKGVGFLRLIREKEGYRLEVCVRKMVCWPDGDYPLFLVGNDKELFLGVIAFRGGEADSKRFLLDEDDHMRIGGQRIPVKELWGVQLRYQDQLIEGLWTVREQSVRLAQDQAENPSEPAPAKELQVQELQTEQRALKRPLLKEDKWAQLQSHYKQVHPFGDERCFISIEPKDFVILKDPYQRLANNSFLLHGFYNYRHIIVGRDREMGEGEGLCFYLGVPGTYFEREKMVAVMFGFEGFECSGAVEIGKFGYYMRRVEI